MALLSDFLRGLLELSRTFLINRRGCELPLPRGLHHLAKVQAIRSRSEWVRTHAFRVEALRPGGEHGPAKARKAGKHSRRQVLFISNGKAKTGTAKIGTAKSLKLL